MNKKNPLNLMKNLQILNGSLKTDFWRLGIELGAQALTLAKADADLISPNFDLLSVRASASSSSSGNKERSIIRKEKDGVSKINYADEKPPTPLLDTINNQIHTKNLSKQDLEQLAAKLRADIPAGSFGIGHQGLQAFPKGTRAFMRLLGQHTVPQVYLRVLAWQLEGICWDLGKNNSVISVIRDGAMTAGQAYEAMNNAGFLDANLIVILSNNRQVSLPTATMDGPATPVGSLSSALSKFKQAWNC
ncbi:hypothetical protein PIB30_064957 [Stylosanthes scabra]|uniref:Transketolase signature 1 domain-containing protein n=1 Tax=Stylosanthes scabra TaxID=79078 RepID=A0ABU6SLY4_9FABA|nr:hypothetical protein [Stylosanthes scabra]